MLFDPRRTRHGHEESQCLVGHSVLGIVQGQIGALRGETHRAPGVLGEEVPQVPRQISS